MFRKIVYLAIITLILSGCARDPVTGQNTLNFYSEADEIKMGNEYHPQIVAQYGEYKDPVLHSYVQNIVTRIGDVSHRPGLEYPVTVLDTPEVNAFAIPGGHVYVCRGILKYFNSEDELAAVMAHEIGHITARHGVERQSTAQGLNLGLLLGAGLIFGDTDEAKSAYKTGMNIAGLGMLSYSRENEMEADRLGIEYATKSGYSPLGMGKVTDLFIRFTGKKDSSFSVLSTHPTSELRQKQARIEVRKWQEQGYNKIALERDRYLSAINNLPLGEKVTKNGTVTYQERLMVYTVKPGDTWANLTNKYFPGNDPKSLAWLNGCELEEPLPARIKLALF